MGRRTISTQTNALRTWRERLGIDQVEAARLLGYSGRSAISRVETGSLPLRTALAAAAVEAGLEPIKEEEDVGI